MIKRSVKVKIFDSIGVYAKAYDNIESLQEKYSQFIPIGDQKTGVIGEFYSMLYLHKLYPTSNITFGNAAQKGWDIEVSRSNKNSKYIQVKTVSEYSKSRRISPIHYGWDELFLLYLDKKFLPIGFWVIDDKTIIKQDEELIDKTMPIPGKTNTGSEDFDNRVDKLSVLVNIIRR